MSDYGNKLVQAIKKIEVLTRELDRANGFHESAAGKLFDSEEENKQLKAQVERLKVMTFDLASKIESQCARNFDLPQSYRDIARKAFELVIETPRQSLLLHDAEVLERASREWLFGQNISNNYTGKMIHLVLNLKANALRQKAQENKS